MSVPPQGGGLVFGTASGADTVVVGPGVHTVQVIYYGDANGFYDTPPPCDAFMQIGRGTLVAHSSLFNGNGLPAPLSARVHKTGNNKAAGLTK